jgi:hypothetical protein
MSQDQYAFEILLVYRGSTFTNSLCHCFVQESKDRKNVEHGSLTLPFQSVEPNDLPNPVWSIQPINNQFKISFFFVSLKSCAQFILFYAST